MGEGYNNFMESLRARQDKLEYPQQSTRCIEKTLQEFRDLPQSLGLPNAAKAYIEQQVQEAKGGHQKATEEYEFQQVVNGNQESWECERRLAARPDPAISFQAQLPEIEMESTFILNLGLLSSALLAGGYLIFRCLRRRPTKGHVLPVYSTMMDTSAATELPLVY